LAAGLGEAAGHVAGGVASVLAAAGVDADRAAALQAEVERGAILLAVHPAPGSSTTDAQVSALTAAGAREVHQIDWPR